MVAAPRLSRVARRTRSARRPIFQLPSLGLYKRDRDGIQELERTRLNGRTVALSDYDDQLFQGALENLRDGEWLACRVREVSCFGEDGIDDDPEFCWQVYSCKVTVYRGGSTRA